MFHDLYVTYSRQVYSYLLGRTGGSKDVGADLLQDVFMRIWNRMEALERIPEDQRIYWIFSVASNRVKDYYRKSSNQRHAEEQLRDRNKGGGGPTEDLSQLLSGRERYRELESAIGALPEELRCILLMKVVGGMNSSRIGEALEMPAGTVRYKISQARALLAGRLGLSETKLAATERSNSNG